MNAIRTLPALVVIGALAGCMTVTGTLYPMNKDAQNLGVLKATIYEDWACSGGYHDLHVANW